MVERVRSILTSMPQPDFLTDRFPKLGSQLPRLQLATLPTPVQQDTIVVNSKNHPLSIKLDNLTGEIYGGNKIRKLEYLFPRAAAKQCRRIATFGAASSNHALATALYARQAGFDCTCFLSHQTKTLLAAKALNKHIENETEIVRYGGTYRNRIATLRETLWGRNAFVIPMGGSSWLGTIGFVAAGLELAMQIDNGEIPAPDRIYVATGTMGTVAGIAIGLAIAKLSTEIHAVRVSDVSITNDAAMRRLTQKTVAMMNRLDDSVPLSAVDQTRVILRNGYFGPGYAHSTPAADEAIGVARQQLGLTLEPTYTGKAFAALLNDIKESRAASRSSLYWHTYNSVPLGVSDDEPLATDALPQEFLRYFAKDVA